VAAAASRAEGADGADGADVVTSLLLGGWAGCRRARDGAHRPLLVRETALETALAAGACVAGEALARARVCAAGTTAGAVECAHRGRQYVVRAVGARVARCADAHALARPGSRAMVSVRRVVVVPRGRLARHPHACAVSAAPARAFVLRQATLIARPPCMACAHAGDTSAVPVAVGGASRHCELTASAAKARQAFAPAQSAAVPAARAAQRALAPACAARDRRGESGDC